MGPRGKGERKEKNKVSIVIPALNEAKNIGEVLQRINRLKLDGDLEIIVVDGCSTDGTSDVVKKVFPSAKIIIETPKGKGSALKTGFLHASGDIIITMDADGSHSPEELPRLIEPLMDGYEMVKGSRFLPGGGSDDITPVRRFGNSVFVFLVNLLYGTKYTDLCYGYRAFKREALEKIWFTTNGFDCETEQSILAKKAGIRVKEVPSYEKKRANGESNLRTIRDGARILSMIIKAKMKRNSS
jgi:glycosyltransferase involved in cell wall biosynthesis